MPKKMHIWVSLILFLGLVACSGSHSKRAKTSNEHADLSAYKNENSYFYFLLAQLKASNAPQKELDAFLVEALKKDEDSNFLWNLKAYSEAESGQIDDAKASAEEALKHDSNSADTLFLLGKIASFQKDSLAAEKYLQRAIAADVPNEETYQFLAREYYTAGEYPSAIKTLKACAEKVSDSANCLYYLGSIQLEQGNDQAAIEAFTEVSELYPDQIKVLQLLAEVHLKHENYEKALDVYKKIFHLTPEDVAVQIRLGWLYYQLGDQDYALQVFESIQKNYPTADKVNYFLALLYLEKQELDASLTALARIPADSTFFKKAVTQQVAILSEQNKAEQIVPVLSKHLSEVGDAWLHLFLSWQEIQNEKYNSALDILNLGLKRFGNDEDLLFQRALVYERTNEWGNSKKDLQTLIANYPNSAKAYNFLGYSMSERGENLEQALLHVEKANTLDPNKAHINDSLGWIHFKLGHTDQALELLQKAVKLDKEEPTVLEHLGDVYFSLKDKAQARIHYQQSLQILQKTETKTAMQQKQIDGILKKLAEF